MEYKNIRINATRNTLIRSINSFLIFVLLYSLVFFPSDSLNSKIISFVLLLTININFLVKKLFKKENIHIFHFGFAFPVLLIILSTLINNFNFSTAVSNAYILTYILLVMIIISYDIKYEKMFMFSLSCLAILISVSGLLDLVGICNITNNSILEFFRIRNEAIIGIWPTTTFGYVLFFKASPLMIVLVAYALKKKKYILLMLTVAAMGFTGTRGNLYASILVIAVYLLLYKRMTLTKVLASIVIAAGLMFFIPDIISFLMNMSSQKESTDMIKFEHLISIKNLLISNPLYILTGSGLGSYFYSTGIKGYTNLSEYSFVDLFRQIGLIGFIPFMYFLFYPLRTLLKSSNYQWLGVSYVGYLIIAFTNPLLFSSTPFALYVFVYVVFYKEKNNETDVMIDS